MNLVYFYLPGSKNKEIAMSAAKENVSAVGYFETTDALVGIKVPALPRIALLEPDGCVLRFEHPLSIILDPNQLLE